MPPRALVIANPAAARTQHNAVQLIGEEFQRAGWHAEVVATTGPGDARRLAEEGVRQAVDVVAVFGGDGTTMQAAAALVGSEVALGLIPGGTGNLLAGNLRLPLSPARAVRTIISGAPRRLDLGRLENAHGVNYFAVAAGAGIDARVMGETLTEHKQRWGILAYMATTVRLLSGIQSADHLITVDGAEYEANAAMVLIANCGEVIPPLVRLRKGIRPDDGLLDLVVIRANSVGESMRALFEALSEQQIGNGLVGFLRGEEIRVVSSPVEPVQFDGEPAGHTPFTARVMPGALRVMLPPER